MLSKGGESGGDPRSLALRINELEAERRAIEARLPSRDADEVLTQHPKTAERYKQRVADIQAALSKGDNAAREAVELVRELIDRIVVTPTDDGEPMKLELVGNVAALLEEQPLNGGAILAVAGLRFGPVHQFHKETPTNRNGTLSPTRTRRAQWMSGNI